MKSIPHFFRATFIAPFAVAPVLLALFLVSMLLGEYNGSFSESSVRDILAMFGFYLLFLGAAIVVAFGYTLFLGLPVYFILWTRGHAGTVPCVLMGVLLGGFYGVMLMAPVVILFGALCGAAVAATFCKIAGGRRDICYREIKRSEASHSGNK